MQSTVQKPSFCADSFEVLPEVIVSLKLQAKEQIANLIAGNCKT